jgi:hypothetical protein
MSEAKALHGLYSRGVVVVIMISVQHFPLPLFFFPKLGWPLNYILGVNSRQGRDNQYPVYNTYGFRLDNCMLVFFHPQINYRGEEN